VVNPVNVGTQTFFCSRHKTLPQEQVGFRLALRLEGMTALVRSEYTQR